MPDWLKDLLGIGGAGLAGGLLTKEAYDRLSDIGEQAVLGTTVGGQRIPGSSELAQQAIEMSRFQPFTVTTATGGQFAATPSGVTMDLPISEQFIQDMLQGQAESALFTDPYGAAQRQQAAQQAFGLGGQFMGAAAQQPADINLLRGMFTQQAASALGGGVPPQGLSLLQEQQRQLTGGVAPSVQSQLGQLPQDYTPSPSGPKIPAGFMATASTGNSTYYRNPQTGESFTISGQMSGNPTMSEIQPAPEGYQPQEMPSPFQGLRAKGMSPEMLMVTSPGGYQIPVSRNDPRLQGLSDDQIRAKLADPRAYQQAPTIGEFGQQALGMGAAGLGAQAPADIEALRRQYAGLAGQAAQDVLTPAAAREASVYERIRATQRPEEERQRLALEERLAQQGRLGVRTAMFGGTPEQLALSQAQEEAQNRASLAAIQQAQAERQQALGTAQTLGGLFGQQAGLSSQLQSAAQQRAAQLSQLGLSAQQIESQLQSEGLGRAATSAQQAAQLAQLAGGLQAQQAGLGAQYAGLGSQLAMQDLAAQQAQQQLALGALTGSYIPQTQLLAAQQAAQLYPQLQQRGQLFGAGQFGETSMAGLEARLVAEQARANLLGGIGSGILGGLFSPIKTGEGTVGSLFGTLFGG
jgi:hypothetical protein